MSRVVEAVYEDGALKPLEDLGLDEHQRVEIVLRILSKPEAGSQLSAWQAVYEGMTPSEIDEVEAIALDRSGFMKPAE